MSAKPDNNLSKPLQDVPQEKGPKRFLVSLLACLFVAACAIPIANIVIDPFLRFDLVRIDGFNAQKPEFASQARLAKAGIVCRLQPGSIVLGTSRVEVGIDPRHPAWNSYPGPVYNLALAGSGLKEIYLTLQHAVHASPRLHLALVGLDFLMFNAHREAVVFGTEVLGFDEKRLLLSPDQSCWSSFYHDIGLYLGTEGLAYSLATIRNQIPRSNIDDPQHVRLTNWISLYDRDGYLGNNFRAARTHGLRAGFRALFDGPEGRGASQEFYYVSRIWRPAPAERYCFEHDGGGDTINLFREIVDLARRSHIDIRFFINPIHARMLVAIQEAGLWPQYEEWKNRLVGVLADEASTAKAPAFPLWDFSGINSVTTEAVPPQGQRTEMRWWWEPSHYRSSAGDLMLDRILGYSDQAGTVPGDFGIALTPQNMEDWTIRNRDGVRDYIRQAPGEAEIVRDRVGPIMEAADGANCGYDEMAAVAGSQDLKRGDRVAAQAAFAKALAIHSADQRRYEEIGVPYRENGFDKTLRQARRGIELPPMLASWEDYQARGNAFLTAGKLTEATEDFSKALQFSPPNPALYFLRGTTRLRLEQFELAAADFKAGLAIDPNNPTLQTLLREAHARAVDGNVSSWEDYQARGNALLAAGKLTEAAEQFSKALQFSPPNAALYFLRGTTRLRMEQFELAAADFVAGLAIDPKNPTLQVLLKEAKSKAADNNASKRKLSSE